ncbi:MBL fold metallo-hydrolase [Hoeflea prorocentri]|uniref:MBL fold metallo-hydrolase n=1 Tax=Hoeflea prorocentri TaxID=1922333 RepID=A0A9X3UL88_9HYPH|nr:MBL fold metallo-hydrolase [Hoeflea prorocentri]MCY6382627.1 MBL fold metallo-hydrolase [Hoeflea prorocentri]MDA5400427.1 MBL fold metallo-hydrolase [Hoeflea prorocentri]
MTDLTLRAIRAKHGDCLLLFAEDATVLVDGGPSGVYQRFLRDQLEALPKNGDEPPLIDLLMVSHIDADHIDGILDLTDELIEARDEERDPVVHIRRAWCNGFPDTIAKITGAGVAASRADAASLASALDELDFGDFDPCDSKLVLSSVGQGRQLRLDLKALNIDVNQRFKNRLALLGNAASPWKCGALSLDVIGPSQEQIDDLKKKWAKDLNKILKKEADAETAAHSMDTSVSNLASIVVFAEAGGKTALLTGDARGKMIMEWLEETGRLAPGGSVHFDILKNPHHGSKRNVTPEFFERVTADHYVFCGDGKHGNPEPETLKMLFEARPNLDYTVHMTYGPDDLRSHKEFKKKGLIAALDDVLSTPERRAVLRFPAEGEKHIDIIV